MSVFLWTIYPVLFLTILNDYIIKSFRNFDVYLKFNVDKISRVFYNKLYPTETVGIAGKENRYDFIDKGQIWSEGSI